ncbi:tetratricopeptide repeat protein [Nonomuraea sp. NPDC049625]|uniref:tetratricopeptide repeat protein n=1 Tax=Nonomuraea sp. NPDC049625 TaxID=3155775 RepID=UPI00342A91D1
MGSDHPNTLISPNNLAGAYRAAGDLSRAIALHEATLAESERLLGGGASDDRRNPEEARRDSGMEEG